MNDDLPRIPAVIDRLIRIKDALPRDIDREAINDACAYLSRMESEQKDAKP